VWCTRLEDWEWGEAYEDIGCENDAFGFDIEVLDVGEKMKDPDEGGVLEYAAMNCEVY